MHVCMGVYKEMQCSSIHGFRYVLGVLECVLTDKEQLL